MGAVLNLPYHPHSNLLQRFVIQLSAVILSHAQSKPQNGTEVQLLMHSLVFRCVDLFGFIINEFLGEVRYRTVEIYL